MTHKTKHPKPARAEPLKLDIPWEDAAKRLLDTPAKSTPKREVKPRAKRAPKAK